jgi:hypothetical protein
MRVGVTLAGLTVGLALTAGLYVAAQSRYPGVPAPVRESWEYTVVTEPTPSTGSLLSRYGTAGWELVSVLTQDEHAGNTTRTQTYYYFKRQTAVQP